MVSRALALLLSAGGAFATAATPARPWMDSTLSPDRRTEILLAAMTLEEKVAQLGYGGCGSVNSTIERHKDGVGGCGVVGPPPTGPPPPPGKYGASFTNELNRMLNESTRLGIPVSILGETTHSGGAPGTTVFPMPCSQGASWNASLVEEIGRINALQLRASGGDQALSPILQVQSYHQRVV
jgi:beta-glucosidase